MRKYNTMKSQQLNITMYCNLKKIALEFRIKIVHCAIISQHKDVYAIIT